MYFGDWTIERKNICRRSARKYAIQLRPVRKQRAMRSVGLPIFLIITNDRVERARARFSLRLTYSCTYNVCQTNHQHAKDRHLRSGCESTRIRLNLSITGKSHLQTEGELVNTSPRPSNTDTSHLSKLGPTQIPQLFPLFAPLET